MIRRRVERSGLRALLCLLGAAVVAGGILLTPLPAAAHAVLVSSSPTAGATVGTTPDAVVLTFDEPLVATLSHATVIDPTGRRFAGTVSGETMSVPLSTSAPGAYQVAWTTVSEVDGHTITGTLRFGVGVAVRSATEGGSPGPGPGDLVVAVLRAIEYAVLLLACGLVVLRRLAADIPMRVPAVPVAAALLASGVAVVAAEAALATSRLSAGAIADYLSIGVTGGARVTRVGLEAGLLAVAIAVHRLSAVLVTAIVGVIAVAGHAANVEPAWQGIAVNAAHLAAAGVWAGGIMALALLRMAGDWSTTGRPLLPRFSRVAPWAFLASVGLGAVQAAQLLGGASEILHTRYGLTLIAKSAAVAAMVPLSLLAWRRHRAMVRTEAMLAVLVVAAAAALAAYPVIPREARDRTAPAATTAVEISPFPRSGDLTLASLAGDTLVGLTVRPGRPGRNQVFAHLAPAPPTGTGVQLTIDGASSDFTACGPSCHSRTVDLRGGQRLAVRVDGPHGGSAEFTLPTLPAPDGTALAQRAAGWMAGLQRYRVDEVLAGIRSSYVYARPHEMWLRMWLSGVPHDTVWLGSSIYKRRDPTAAWGPPSPPQPPPVPYFPWQPFAPFVDAAIIGTGTLDGVPVSLVSFFGGHGDDPEPVWFTLWIDTATDRVLRSQMWAPSHFMDDHYYAFNEPVDIPRPPGV
jgi:copper transport protein